MQLKQYLAPCSLILGFILCAPLAKPGEVVVNGICYYAATGCPNVDSVSDPSFDAGPGSVSGNFNFDVTVNGDIYNVLGAYSASYSGAGGSDISVNNTITYTGNNGATAQDDTITFDLFQNYFDDTPGSWAGHYTENVPLNLSGPAGSTIQGQILYDGQTVGLVGPFGPGNYTFTGSADLDFGALDTASILAADFNQTIVFKAGAVLGDGASSPAATPEPAMAIPCGIGLLLLSYGLRRRNRSRVAL